jgi:heme-degrading monooxygenase HmoA
VIARPDPFLETALFFEHVCDNSRHRAFFVSAVINGATAKGGLMEKPYTHTTWRVRAGSEDEFVRRWSEWVDWSHREGLEAPALLLRDLENPQAFISFGPWANMAAVRNWRALTGYQERVARLSEVLDSFEPRTLEIVVRR